MATLIRSNGESLEVKASKLEQMQEAVGGLIQMVDFPDGSMMVCHEEGKLRELPYNGAATAIFQLKFRNTSDWIAGDALFFSRAENERMLAEQDAEEST